MEKKKEKTTKDNIVIAKKDEKEDVEMKDRVNSGVSKRGVGTNWSTGETHVECVTGNENMEETYETPQQDSGIFSEETCTDGDNTSNDYPDSVDSVVPKWRRGLEKRPATLMGWTGPSETRDRGVSDEDDSAGSASWEESCDSRVAESELGLTSGHMPQTDPYLPDYDHKVILDTGRIWTDSDESDGSGPMRTVMPKSKAHITQPRPQRAMSHLKNTNRYWDWHSRSNTGEKQRGRSPQGLSIESSQSGRKRTVSNRSRALPSTIEHAIPLRPSRIVSSRGQGFRVLSKNTSHRSVHGRNVHGENEGPTPLHAIKMKPSNAPSSSGHFQPMKVALPQDRHCSTFNRKAGETRDDEMKRMSRETSHGESEKRSKSMVVKPTVSNRNRNDSVRSSSAQGFERKKSKKWLDHLKKQGDRHVTVKEEALKLWKRLDNPAVDSPLNPEKGFSLEAINVAKRGRQCAVESSVCGSTATRRAIRNWERSAKNNGDPTAEAQRLMEYPRATQRYLDVMVALQKLAGNQQGR